MNGVQLPCVWRPIGASERLTVKLPFNPADRAANPKLLKELLGDRIQVRQEAGGRWRIARAHFAELTTGLAQHFGHVDAVLDFNPAMKCDTRCVAARGDDCVCSCLGENHGGAQAWRSWQQVGQTTLIENGAKIHQLHLRTYASARTVRLG